MEKLILKKIALLREMSMRAIVDENNASIIKNFTEESIKVLNADFGFAWGKFNDIDKYRLVYKSLNAPHNPIIPKQIKEKNAVNKRENLLFDNNVKRENYKSNISRYFKSYIIIPVSYGEHVYGSIVLCYRKQHDFTEEELVLSLAIENAIGHIVTINWLVEKDQKALALAEKQKATEILLEQEKLKTEFIANATHELRTPLAIMKGSVELALMNKKETNSAKKAFRAVNAEINILSEILKDMALLTSTGENVKDRMNREDVSISNLLAHIVRRMRTVANKKNITIKIKTKKNLDIVVRGDEKYLEKLFLNIIKNAITYTEDRGHITVDISRNKNAAIIKIKDDGVGIAKEDLPKIFERFYRGDKAHTNTSYGSHSGLGLAIAKWAAEMYGGTISVTSTEGKGSTFSVFLPIAPEKN